MKYPFKALALFILTMPLFATAQKESIGNSAFDSRIFTGGSLGLQFGTYTFVDVEPIVGYRVTERFAAGIGAAYIYSKFKDPYGTFSYSTNIYGGSIFARYYITDNIFAHVEYEVLNLEAPTSTNYYSGNEGFQRQNITEIFIGGGYREAIGERTSVNILLLYDINQDPFSPYQNPIIVVGFGIGI